jgi:hypothetical protein
MKKIFAYLFIAVFIAGCTQTPDDNSQLANPSATFCIEQGYNYSIRDTSLGQSGYCIFDDGKECEAWAYYREECTIETASSCKNLCGDGNCQSMVCQAIGCTCAETAENCPNDCLI